MLFFRLIPILIFSVLAIFPANAQTSEKDYPKNVIRFNPASLIFNNYSFFYERAVNEKISIQAGINYMTNTWETGTNFNGKNYSGSLVNKGFGITPEVRYYFLNALREAGKPAPFGLYVGGFGRYQQNNFTFNYIADSQSDQAAFKSQIFTLGGLIGVQGIISKTVAIDFFVGPDVNYLTAKMTKAPDVKIFDGDEVRWVDTNWLTKQFLQYFAQPGGSAFFPGIRAGVTAGVAF